MSDYEFSDEEREKEIQRNKKTHREENPDLKNKLIEKGLINE